MFRPGFKLVILVIFLGVFPASCSLDTGLPVCSTSEFSMQPIYPRRREIINILSSPLLNWEYLDVSEDGSSIQCDPSLESQDIQFGIITYDESGGAYTTLVTRNLATTDRHYTPGMALEPHQSYFWTVGYVGTADPTYKTTEANFETGPICSREELSPPIILAVPDGATIESQTPLVWDYAEPCTPDRIFFNMSSSPTFGLRDDTWMWSVSANKHTYRNWVPCQYHYWRIASAIEVPSLDLYDPSDEFFPFWDRDAEDIVIPGYLLSMYTKTRSFYVIGEECSKAPEEPAPEIPTVPSVLLTTDANCRSGPTLDYPVLAILQEGVQLEIRGRNAAGDSWQVFNTEIDAACWVNADLVDLIGIADLVEIVIPPPPPLIGPTDTPASSIVDCSIYNTDPTGCNNNPACYWDLTDPLFPNGYCKNE